jgi:PA14 domain
MQHLSLKRGITLLIPILAVILLGMARGNAAAEDSQWHTRFWNNTNFSGDPVHERYDNAIDFDWGEGAPSKHVDDDNFSVKWRRNVHFEPGVYRFTATMDDGMRVYVDDQLVIDSWTDSQEHTMTNDVQISGGDHQVKVDYYEVGGNAVAKVNWQLIHPEGQSSGTGGGQFFPNWKAEYFNNTSLSGAPVLVRDDRYLNQNWGTGSPAPGVVNEDFFSARWTKTLTGNPGTFYITMTSDDGSRLYVNNQLLIDNWAVQAPTTRAATYNYTGGPVQVRVEYFENTENASINVALDRTSGTSDTATQPVPVPVPPASACVQPTGSSAAVNVSSLNFREGPAVQFAVLDTLVECQVVQLTGYRNPVEAASPWVQVILPDGRTAWANANYMVLGVPLSQMTVLSD